MDNETRLVSFIPVSIKISFPSWFSDTCCCVLVQSPAGGVGKQAHSVPPVFLEFRAKRNSVTDTEFCLKKEKLRGFENGGPNQGDCFLSGPDRGLCTSSCCFLLFSPCFCRARLVRDSWGLVQGMMTEQDSLSSPVHIPAACLPFPSAHPPSAPPPRCQVILPSHTPVPAHLLHITTPPLHEARDPSPPSSAWGTPSSFILPLPRVRAAHMALSPGYQKEKLRPGRWGGKMGRQSPNLSVTPDAARGLSSLPLSHSCSSPALGTDLPIVIADDLAGRAREAVICRSF